MEAIKRALSLDENLAEAYSTLCENKMYYEYDFVGAESACGHDGIRRWSRPTPSHRAARGSAEGEGEGRRARIEKLDLEQPIRDGLRLSD